MGSLELWRTMGRVLCCHFLFVELDDGDGYVLAAQQGNVSWWYIVSLCMLYFGADG